MLLSVRAVSAVFHDVTGFQLNLIIEQALKGHNTADALQSACLHLSLAWGDVCQASRSTQSLENRFCGRCACAWSVFGSANSCCAGWCDLSTQVLKMLCANAQGPALQADSSGRRAGHRERGGNA